MATSSPRLDLLLRIARILPLVPTNSSKEVNLVHNLEAHQHVTSFELSNGQADWERMMFSLTADELASCAQVIDRRLSKPGAVLGHGRRVRLRTIYSDLLIELGRRQLRLL